MKSKEAQINKAAKIIWDYHNFKNKPLKKADLILVLCSHDLRTAEYAAELMLNDYAPLVVFSGGIAHQNDLLATNWGISEAEKFAEITMEMGVPKEKILIENQAQNTGDNVVKSFELIKKAGIKHENIIIVQKPYMLRRAYAVFKKQWPEGGAGIILTAPDISFEDYAKTKKERDTFINIMVGDLQRIKEYPAKGFQIYQEIPDEVWNSFEALVAFGYDKHLMK